MRVLLFFIFSQYLFSQQLSVGLQHSSTGTGDIIGKTINTEYNFKSNSAFNFGLNLGWTFGERQSWNFINPFTLERYIYDDKINIISLSPFLRFNALNFKKFKFYLNIGPTINYYNLKYHLGGYNVNYNLNSFDNFVYNAGNKGLELGYFAQIGIEFLIINKITLSPYMKFGEIKDNSIASLGINFGYKF